ncbi:MerR family transcriptional regulator [Paenibacillus sp. JCM 10914]|uniref:MerR family transcriptional regulator n=1 Tax=Paenibacillus sp. JCM 10914 TaxID=1236974 RepID=UPI0003CC6153|nr:MerR family transcriptional regulator [Paenibacillus sp. JCM 10914]GAE04021.1 transcriptional regulator [Paenibacillus sp. JCM 10914]
MRIRELSVQTGVSIRSLRYYEEKGLIAPVRLDNGYREYRETDVHRVKTIQLFLDLGLSTDEIQPIIDCTSSISPRCAPEAITLYEDKLKDTQQQIKILMEVESKLKNLLAFWREKELEQMSEVFHK